MNAIAPEKDLTRMLALELFRRTGISSAAGVLGVGIMAYPHIGTTPWQTIATWATVMVLIFFARGLTSRYALRALKNNKWDARFISLETCLCAVIGLGWGSAVYVFDSAKMDPQFFMRLMILAAAMAFILSSTAVFVRIFLAYTLTTSVTAIAFILTHDYVQPQDVLALSVALYLAMLVFLGVSTNRRIRSATINQIAVANLTEELKKALDAEQRLREAMSQSAVTDELTGILNRRGILDSLGMEIARSRRYGLPLAVLMIDVDFFKRINDVYGHAAGDTAIRTVVQSVHSGLRDTDTLGRIGGEEFVAILPSVDSAGAVGAAERLRAGVEKAEVLLAEGPVKITISIGVSVYRANDVSEIILARADNALYAAKHNGRNRVEIETHSISAHADD